MLNFEKMNQTFNLRMGKVFTVNGDDGASAYEIAVENGFRGTEKEWLQSLHGKDGQPGRDGADGKDGAPGVDGKSAYQYAVDGGYTGTEEEFAAKLAEEVDLTNYYTKEETDAAISEATAEGKYELIETITIEEDDVLMVERTAEPDGTPYKLKGVYIWVTIPANAYTKQTTLLISSLGAKDEDGTYWQSYTTMLVNTSETYAFYRSWIENGRMDNEYIQQSNTIYMNSTLAKRIRNICQRDAIEKIRLKAQSGEVKLAKGMKIDIWGVRA